MRRLDGRPFSLAVLALLAPSLAWAGYYPPLYTAERASAMGGAFVALADDEEAIFINPAGMAGNKGFSFNIVPVDVEIAADNISSVYGLIGLYSNLANVNGNVLNTFMGKDLYASVQIAPTLTMPNFGFALIANQQYGLVEQNIANPVMGLTDVQTNGMQAAYGFSLLPKSMRQRGDLRVGFAGKMLWRRGGYYDLDFLEVLSLASSPVNTLHSMVGAYALGFGMDAGAQYLYNASKRVTVSAGIAMTDIGDTTFASQQSSPLLSNLTAGVGFSYKLSRIKINADFDYSHILDDQDFFSKTHFGLELQLPFVSLQGGLDQTNLTCGASFDVWILRISANTYASELDSYAGQNTERRYGLRVAFKL